MGKRVTVEISEDLHREFKTAAAKHSVTITDVIRALVIKWLREQVQAEVNKAKL